MSSRTKLFFAFFLILSTVLSAKTFDIKHCGANCKGEKSNTTLINKLIKRLNIKGGGVLYFPAGKYKTGPIKLMSNVTIELENGAELIFSNSFDDYLPFIETRCEGIMMKSFVPLIYAVDAENIAIKGDGVINGQGAKWWNEFYRLWDDYKVYGKRNISKYQQIWDEENDIEKLYAEINDDDYLNTFNRRFFRPALFQPIRCRNVKIEGIQIKNAPCWTINPQFCQDVLIDKVTILNSEVKNTLSKKDLNANKARRYYNTDGINPESCSNVIISNCTIYAGDDCITLKSGRDLQGRKINIPCENITITNCLMLSGHGGIVIGSEMSGGVKNVTVSNCVFNGIDRGIRIKSTRGRGGIVENILFNNILMDNISKEGIDIDLEYTSSKPEPLSERTPIVRNIKISNVKGINVQVPIFIRGLLESPIRNIELINIDMHCTENYFLKNCFELKQSNVLINDKYMIIN